MAGLNSLQQEILSEGLLVEKVKQEVRSRFDITRDVDDEMVLEEIDRVLLDLPEITVKCRRELRKEIFNSFRGLDVLSELLEDEDVTEIMVNGEKDIYYEKNGILARWPKSFSGREKLEDVIQQIVAGVNRRVNTSSPIVDARLPDGSRVNVVLPPAAVDGPIVTIRRFPKIPMTMEKLIELGSINEEVADFLSDRVRRGNNIFVSGGTGTGKTTFLNALSGAIPEDERVITVEDSAELQLACKNLVKLEARSDSAEGTAGITIRELIRAALRMRPDRLIVGEVRGPEALDMLQAMNTGHDGSLSTGHANSIPDMLSRLETMVLMGGELPMYAVRSQIGSALDLMIHLGRFRDGSRRVVSICEVLGYKDGEIKIEELYANEGGRLRKTGDLSGSESKGRLQSLQP